MSAYDRAAMRDQRFDRQIKRQECVNEINSLHSLVDELTQLQINYVEDGETFAAREVGRDILNIKASIKEIEESMK